MGQRDKPHEMHKNLYSQNIRSSQSPMYEKYLLPHNIKGGLAEGLRAPPMT